MEDLHPMEMPEDRLEIPEDRLEIPEDRLEEEPDLPEPPDLMETSSPFVLADLFNMASADVTVGMRTSRVVLWCGESSWCPVGDVAKGDAEGAYLIQ